MMMVMVMMMIMTIIVVMVVIRPFPIVFVKCWKNAHWNR